MNDYGHRVTYAVKTYDIDAAKRITIPALVRMMQEAAMENVLRLGVSVWDLEPEALSWVLMRKQLHIDRLPLLGEDLTIETYPAGFDGPFTFRDYHIFDSEGQPVAHAGTRWLLMNLESRRPARVPVHIRENVEVPDPGTCLPRPDRSTLTPPGPAATETYFRVHYHDLDFNQHLNNTIYIRWLLDALPAALPAGGGLTGMDITYHHEARLGDRIISRCEKVATGHYLHQLLRETDETELARGLTRWQ